MRILVEGLGATVGSSDGAGRYVLGLLGALARRKDVYPTALVGPSLGQAAREVSGLERLIILPTPDRARRLAAQHFLAPLLGGQRRADAVIYTGSYAPLLPGPPAVVVVQNLLLAFHRPEYGRARAIYRRWSKRHLARRAAVVVPISQVLADALDPAARARTRFAVVHPGVDAAFFNRAALAPREAPERYFLAVGTAWAYRDYPLALRALAASGLPHELVIVGEVPRAMRVELEREAASLGLSRRLRLVGLVAELDMLLSWYAGAAALLCTSKFEAFALGACEAMAAGTPVIAARRTVYPEVIVDGGLLVDPTPTAFAAALRNVLEPERRRALVEAGSRRARELSWDRCAADLVRVCREAARREFARG